MTPTKAVIILAISASIIGGVFYFLFQRQVRPQEAERKDSPAVEAQSDPRPDERTNESGFVVNGKVIPVEGTTTIEKSQSIIDKLDDPRPVVSNEEAREVLLQILNNGNSGPSTDENEDERQKLLKDLNK